MGSRLEKTIPGIITIYPDIWGFPKMGIPQNGWFVMENPNLKWMITRGAPITGNLRIISSIASKKNNVSVLSIMIQ